VGSWQVFRQNLSCIPEETASYIPALNGGVLRRVLITQADAAELYAWAKNLQSPIDLVEVVAKTGKLPVPLFCAGGLATPADASLVMQLGAEAVFVGSGIFKSSDPAKRARAIVDTAFS